MRGLDPRIHDAAPPSQAVLIFCHCNSSRIAGSIPAMTAERSFGGLGFSHAASFADGVHDTLGVMRGLDPRIHDAAPPSQAVLILPLQSIMDCQVKPGN